MITPNNIRTITDLRQNTLSILNYALKTQEPVFILQHSRPKGVFLSMDKYQKLVELVEDYLDIIEAEETLDSSETKFLPMNKLWKKYKLAG